MTTYEIDQRIKAMQAERERAKRQNEHFRIFAHLSLEAALPSEVINVAAAEVLQEEIGKTYIIYARVGRTAYTSTGDSDQEAIDNIVNNCNTLSFEEKSQNLKLSSIQI